MFKQIIKKIIPKSFLKLIKNYLDTLRLKKFKKLSNEEVFRKIYDEKLWTPDDKKEHFNYYSGLGSHSHEFTEVYLKEVNKFLMSFNNKQNVVDLGCGDFSIGSQIRKNCNDFIAIDIFDEIIEANKKKFKDMRVEFKAIDFTNNKIPKADICMLRFVLQHLSNESILNFLKLSADNFKYIILTEHLPDIEKFVANLDMPTSSYID